jgi:transposase
MYLRHTTRRKDGKVHRYWRLVRSVRVGGKVVQQTVAHLGELFALDDDLLLYDVTSTYFEGQAVGNPLAHRGHGRDDRPDCKQVGIALVVSREGMPVGYELFAGNRTDVTTVEEIVEAMEARYGLAHRIWVMDRGMTSEDNRT